MVHQAWFLPPFHADAFNNPVAQKLSSLFNTRENKGPGRVSDLFKVTGLLAAGKSPDWSPDPWTVGLSVVFYILRVEKFNASARDTAQSSLR